jgi:hypothetical protein
MAEVGIDITKEHPEPTATCSAGEERITPCG